MKVRYFVKLQLTEPPHPRYGYPSRASESVEREAPPAWESKEAAIEWCGKRGLLNRWLQLEEVIVC